VQQKDIILFLKLGWILYHKALQICTQYDQYQLQAQWMLLKALCHTISRPSCTTNHTADDTLASVPASDWYVSSLLQVPTGKMSGVQHGMGILEQLY